MRQIILDTETTGIDVNQGHRVIEIGCVEIINRKITNHHFHVYINPEREIDEGAFNVHGISQAFLSEKPLFSDVLDEFLDFIQTDEIIIHNAPFDVGFLNKEFQRAQLKKPLDKLCKITDTLLMARAQYPGQRNSLDALCKRLDIDNSNRQLHGALLDAEILARVYLAMTGGQSQLFQHASEQKASQSSNKITYDTLESTTPVIHASPEELAKHEAFILMLQEKSGKSLWD